MSLTLTHRPRLKSIPKMLGEYDYVVVLLKLNEGSANLIRAYREAGVQAFLVPFTVGLLGREPMNWDSTSHVRNAVQNVSRDLQQGMDILVHCSAGVHRTGTFAYAVFRHQGYSQAEALEQVKTLRNVSYHGILPFVEWAENTLVDPAWVYDCSPGCEMGVHGCTSTPV